MMDSLVTIPIAMATGKTDLERRNGTKETAMKVFNRGFDAI